MAHQPLLIGVHHHISEALLSRYLVEFDFRYSNRAALVVDDTARTMTAPQGVVGKRLTYLRPDAGFASAV